VETHKNFKKFSKFVLGEQSGNFREKNTPLINFSTVQPIASSNILINSSHQGEQNESSTFSQFHSRGAGEEL
jgi:hypothetical protein